VKNGLSMAMSGIPWWNSDIGGFHSGDPGSPGFRELLVRWFQFGTFSPLMRLHGARLRQPGHADRHQGILEKSCADNEVWSYGDELYPILKSLIELRGRLKPYIIGQMRIAAETGTPLMRPLFFDYPDDEACYPLEDQYLFGSDIVFAPIVDQGRTERPVYLPEGSWIDVRSRQERSGGTTVICTARIHEFIAFAKKGSAVLDAF
jgi:alpha-D-xyloside xylohydrolase